MLTTTDAVSQLRAQLEEAVSRPGLTTEERAENINRVRAEIVKALGVADTYLADLATLDEAAGFAEMRLAQTARQNADIRAESIERGLATAEEMDAIGFFSHDALDEAAEEDRLVELCESAVELAEAHGVAFGLGLLRGNAFNLKVRRGMGGQFQDKPGSPKVAKGRGGSKLKPSKLHDDIMLGKSDSAIPPEPHAASHQPQGGLVHPARLEAKVPTDAEKARGVTKKLKGKSGAVKGKEFKVFDTPKVDARGEQSRVREKDAAAPGDRPQNMSTAQLRHDRAQRGTTPATLDAKGQQRLTRMEDEARRRAAEEKDPEKKAELERAADKLAAQHGDMQARAQAGKGELYDERSEKLNKRIGKRVKKSARKIEKGPKSDRRDPGAGGHDLSQAETHLNDAGRVSSRTLLRFAEEEASQPTTVERYRNPDGSYVASRQALHERIIDGMLRQRNPDGSISFTLPYLEPPEGEPTVLFTGGGYAAGKGTIQRAIDARGETPPDAMLLDPDVIKSVLPEFQDMIGDDPEANLLVYQEAWDIAQEVQERAKAAGLNVVVDGIANTSSEEVAGRVQGFKDAGYGKVRMVYVSVPTEVAISRAANRARNAEKDSDRRMIPDIIMRSVHRDVSATLPGVLDQAEAMGATVEVWDTDKGKDEMPSLVAIARPDGGGTQVKDEAKFQEVLDKANEAIPGLDKKIENPRPLPGSTTHVAVDDPDKEKAIGRVLEEELAPATGKKKSPQPVADPAELVKLGTDTGLDEFKGLMGDIATALDADTVDFSEGGKDFAAEGKKIRDSGKPTVIIGPVKKLERIKAKMAADGETDAKGITDVVRGTVVVPELESLGDAVKALKAQIGAEGEDWSIDIAKNRIADGSGSRRFEGNGYGDLMLIVRGPTMSYELQVNTTPLWYEKELGEGHGLYARERSLLEKPDVTEDDMAQVRMMQAKSKPLYDLAHTRALAGNAQRVKREEPQA